MTLDADPALIPAIDISRVQGRVDFARVARAGVRVVIAKATEGVTYDDPAFTDYMADAHAAGLVRGAYHFFRESDPEQQAASFLRACAACDPAPAVLVLDAERGITSELDLPDRLIAFLRALAATAPTIPRWLYCSPMFAVEQRFGDHPELAELACCWTADWRTVRHPEPEVPAPWTTWVARQTGGGFVDGVPVRCDLDVLRAMPGG